MLGWIVTHELDKEGHLRDRRNPAATFCGKEIPVGEKPKPAPEDFPKCRRCRKTNRVIS